MTAQNVLPKTGDPPKPPASDEDIAAFEKDHTGGPVVGQPIMMHWKAPFSSDWNRQAIFVLASAFLEQHSDCPFTIAQLKVLFSRKLERTRQEWLNTQAMQMEEINVRRAEAAKKRRQYSRLQGVSYPHSHLPVADGYVPQTYYRRGAIIDKYFDSNPAFWGQVQVIYDALGVDGMSSDETETERAPDGLKKVRRVAKVWLSGTVSAMWENIESYHHHRLEPRKGNRAFGRICAPKNSSTAKAVRGLPRNLYNPLWWTSLILVDQQHMEPMEEVALPDCSVYVAFRLHFSRRI